MVLQVALLVERLVAHVAGKRLGPRVDAAVRLERGDSAGVLFGGRKLIVDCNYRNFNQRKQNSLEGLVAGVAGEGQV